MIRPEMKSVLSSKLDKLTDEQFEGIYQMVTHMTTEKSVYETAPQHVRDSIHEGLAQLERGEAVPMDEVFASTDKLLKAHGV